jgi:hypothetical protein
MCKVNLAKKGDNIVSDLRAHLDKREKMLEIIRLKEPQLPLRAAIVETGLYWFFFIKSICCVMQ